MGPGGRYPAAEPSKVDIHVFPFHSAKLYIDPRNKVGYLATTEQSAADYKTQGFEEYQLVCEGLKEHEVGVRRQNQFPSSSSSSAKSSALPQTSFPSSFTDNLPSTYYDLVAAYEVGRAGMTPIVGWTSSQRKKWNDGSKSSNNFLNICKDYVVLHGAISKSGDRTVDGATSLKDIRKVSRTAMGQAEETAKKCHAEVPLLGKLK